MSTTTPTQRAAVAALLAKADTALAANVAKSAALQDWLDNGPFSQAATLAAVKVIAADLVLVHKELNALIRLTRGMYGAHADLVDGSDT